MAELRWHRRGGVRREILGVPKTRCSSAATAPGGIGGLQAVQRTTMTHHKSYCLGKPFTRYLPCTVQCLHSMLFPSNTWCCKHTPPSLACGCRGCCLLVCASQLGPCESKPNARGWHTPARRPHALRRVSEQWWWWWSPMPAIALGVLNLPVPDRRALGMCMPGRPEIARSLEGFCWRQSTALQRRHSWEACWQGVYWPPAAAYYLVPGTENAPA